MNKLFDQRIKNLIDMFSVECYLIHPNKNIDCVCKDFDTKQGSKSCPICLSTGNQITIRIIEAAKQPYSLSDMQSKYKFSSDGSVFYSKDIYPVHTDDIIVYPLPNNKWEIAGVNYSMKYESTTNIPVYYQSYCADKKFDTIVFLKNLSKIVKRDLL